MYASLFSELKAVLGQSLPTVAFLMYDTSILSRLSTNRATSVEE